MSVLLFVETEEYARDLQAMDPPHTATTVRRDGTGNAAFVDGPFVEGKEVVSRYAEVEAANLGEVPRRATRAGLRTLGRGDEACTVDRRALELTNPTEQPLLPRGIDRGDDAG